MKRTVLFSLLTSIVVLCAAAAPAAPDPEIFEAKGKERNYAGVFPEKVKTIAVVTIGSYPSPVTVKRAAALLRKAGYKVKIYPNALRPREKTDVGHYASMPAKYRIQDFEAAWKDKENDMILCTRGGAAGIVFCHFTRGDKMEVILIPRFTDATDFTDGTDDGAKTAGLSREKRGAAWRYFIFSVLLRCSLSSGFCPSGPSSRSGP